MKKISLVVIEKDRETSLERLREIGVLHPEKKKISSEKMNNLMEMRKKNLKALFILRRYERKNNPTQPCAHTALNLVDSILRLSDEKRSLQGELTDNIKEKRRLEAWGDFDQNCFAYFLENNVTLIPYQISLKNYDSLNTDIKLIVLSKDKKAVRVLAVDEPIPDLSPFIFPVLSLSQITKQMDSILIRIGEIEKELASYACYRQVIEEENNRLLTEIEFETANVSMETREDAAAVSWINGYLPNEKQDIFKKAAKEHDWALMCGDPKPEDRPPTLIKNNAFVRIIQPLFSFLGTVPGYREYDISTSYLVFLCLFFAMIFGDAGYGVLLLALSIVSCFILRKKSSADNFFASIPDVSKLFMLLSFCTVVWGSITGSWFALPAEKLPSFLRFIIIPPFNDTGPLAEFPVFLQNLFNLPSDVPVDDLKTRWNIQFLCFTVGLTQLVWARSKNITKLLPSLSAIGQAGWLIMMIGLYFLVLFMLLKVALPSFAVWLIGGGVVLYFIFSEQNGGNFFKNIVKSLSNFLTIFLNAVSSFADIISYIRLFAVGLAGGIIAESFNNMAIPSDGLGSFGAVFLLRLLAAVLILVFGHAINIAMNALSVIVHGVRLNLLEYAGNHLGMEWTGYVYKPFKLKEKKE